MNDEKQNQRREDTQRLIQWSQALQQQASALRAEAKATILAGKAVRKKHRPQPGKRKVVEFYP